MRYQATSSLALLFSLCCTTSNTDYYTRGGDPPVLAEDLSGSAAPGLPAGGADGRQLTCDETRARVVALLMHSRTCKEDTECVVVTTSCGLPGGCGEEYANTGWRTSEMEALIARWEADGCGMRPCRCSEAPGLPPSCNDGMCGPKKSKGAVGAPCTSDDECVTSQCLTEAQDTNYAGGYCTIKGCSDARRCPEGSACVGFSGNGTRICLRQCSRVGLECRKGYACCSGPGPVPGTGRGSYCAPERSPLCLAR